MIEAIETDEIQKMRKIIGSNQHKHTRFTEILKGYIEEELPHLPSSKEAIRKLILELVRVGFVKKIGTQPLTTYNFIDKEAISSKGVQKQIIL